MEQENDKKSFIKTVVISILFRLVAPKSYFGYAGEEGVSINSQLKKNLSMEEMQFADYMSTVEKDWHYQKSKIEETITVYGR